MSKYTMRDGAKMHVTEIGRGEPVVLIHGLGMDGTSWLPFASVGVLNKRFYIPDLRGWGRSRDMPMDENYYVGQLADDIQDLILKIGAPKVAIVGISLGAGVGLEYLKRYGDQLISRYLHIDFPTSLIKEENPKALPESLVSTGEAMLEEARYFDPAVPLNKLPKSYQKKHFALLYGVLRNSLKMPWQKAVAMSIEYNPVLKTFLSEHSAQGCWYAALRSIHSFASGQYDVRDSLSKISIPVTNVVGTHDTLFPLSELKHVSELLPNSKTVEFYHSGHLLMVTEIPKFTKVFRAFLAEGNEPDAYQVKG